MCADEYEAKKKRKRELMFVSEERDATSQIINNSESLFVAQDVTETTGR